MHALYMPQSLMSNYGVGSVFFAGQFTGCVLRGDISLARFSGSLNEVIYDN